MQKQNREALRRIAELRKWMYENKTLEWELTVTMVYPNKYDCDAGENPCIPHFWSVKLVNGGSWSAATLLEAVKKAEKDIRGE